MLANVFRFLVAVVVAVAAHGLLLLLLLRPQEQTVLIEGGRIQVQFGAGGANTAAARADQGADPVQETVESDLAETTETVPLEPQQETDERVEPPDEPSLDSDLNEGLAPLQDEQPPEPDPPANAAEPEVQETSPVPVTQDSGTTLDTDTQDGDQDVDSVDSAPAGSASASPDADTTQLQEGNAASANYAGDVLRHLSRVRRPRASSPGSAVVTFTIGLDGQLEAIDVTESSGSRRFDRDAIKVVERGEPFPVPPPGVNRTFTIEIEGS